MPLNRLFHFTTLLIAQKLKNEGKKLLYAAAAQHVGF